MGRRVSMRAIWSHVVVRDCEDYGRLLCVGVFSGGGGGGDRVCCRTRSINVVCRPPLALETPESRVRDSLAEDRFVGGRRESSRGMLGSRWQWLRPCNANACHAGCTMSESFLPVLSGCLSILGVGRRRISATRQRSPCWMSRSATACTASSAPGDTGGCP